MATDATEELRNAVADADDTPKELQAAVERITEMLTHARPVRFEMVQREGKGHFSVELSDE